MATLNPGVIYELREDTDEYLKGSRWEFISGADDDTFSDGLTYDFFGADELLRSPDQSPLGFSEEMQHIKAQCLAGASLETGK